jgi:hypothetical protein
LGVWGFEEEPNLILTENCKRKKSKTIEAGKACSAYGYEGLVL